MHSVFQTITCPSSSPFPQCSLLSLIIIINTWILLSRIKIILILTNHDEMALFCPLNWWGNWGSENWTTLSKVKQLSSILQIWDSSKDKPFNPKENTQPQIVCLALIIFTHCLLHHPKEKTTRACLYHWGKMRIILKSFSFAPPYFRGLTLSYFPSRGIPVLM